MFEEVGSQSDAEHRVELAANRLVTAIEAVRAEDPSVLVESVRGALFAARRAIDDLLDA